MCAEIWNQCRDAHSFNKWLSRAEFEMALGLVAQAQQNLRLDAEAIRRGQVPSVLPRFPGLAGEPF